MHMVSVNGVTFGSCPLVLDSLHSRNSNLGGGDHNLPYNIFLSSRCYIEMIKMPKAPKLWVLKFPCYEFIFETYTFKDLFQWCIKDPIWTTFITCTFVQRITTFCDLNFWGDCIFVVFFHFLLHHSLRFHVTPSKISIVQARLNASFSI